MNMNYPNYYQNYPSYQQQYQQPIQPMPPVVQPQVHATPILDWVQSEDEAMNYPLNTGQSIFLMSQREPYLYMRSVDQLGKSTFIKKRLVDESDNKDSNLRDYIRREELDNLISDRIQREIEKRMSEISFKPTKKRNDEE